MSAKEVEHDSAAEKVLAETEEETEEEDDEDDDDDENAARMDKGWAWVVMTASFFANLITDGITFCSGLVLSELVITFHGSVSKTAWVSSLLSGTSMLAGPLSATLTNHFGFRAVIIGGSLLGSLGLSTSFWAPSVDLLFLTTGIITGIGFCMVYTPSVVAISFYFRKKRALATGIALCGSGVGMFIFAPLTTWLIDNYGIRGTFLILGGLYLNCCVCGSLIPPVNMNGTAKQRNRSVVSTASQDIERQDRVVHQKEPRRLSKLVMEPIALFHSKDRKVTNAECSACLITHAEHHHQQKCERNWTFLSPKSTKKMTKSIKSQLSLFKSPSFVLICASSFVDSIGFYVPHMFLAAHAVHCGISKESASFLISIIGICNSVGRIAFGWIADQSWSSVLLLNNASLTVAGLLTIAIPFFTTYSMLITYSVLLGLTIACPVVTRPILLAELVGVENVNNAFGLILLFYGISGIVGIPLAGLIYDLKGDYAGTFYFSGSVLLLAGILCYPLGYINRWERKKKKKKRRNTE